MAIGQRLVVLDAFPLEGGLGGGESSRSGSRHLKRWGEGMDSEGGLRRLLLYGWRAVTNILETQREAWGSWAG